MIIIISININLIIIIINNYHLIILTGNTTGLSTTGWLVVLI